MSETLCVEGLDRDALIEEIRSVYGPDVEITSVTGERRGGLFGFFTREYLSVTFEPRGAPPADPPSADPAPADGRAVDPAPADGRAAESGESRGRHAAPDLSPVAPSPATSHPVAGPAGQLDALLARADRDDGPDRMGSGRELGRLDTELSFAQLLAAMSAEQAGEVTEAAGGDWVLAAQASPAPSTATAALPSSPIAALPSTPSTAWPPSATAAWPPPPRVVARPAEPDSPRSYPASRARLDMLSELGAIGVPVSMNPGPGVVSVHEAIEQLIDALPVAPVLPLRAGEILVLAGSVEQLAPAAAVLAQQLHLAPEAIWWAGPAAPGRSARLISGPAEAAGRAIQLRASSSPSIVAVELEQTAPGEVRFGWAPQVIAALQPSALWAAVDAGRKTADLRLELSLLGTIDALVVSGAARTASPATVWDLEIPVAIIDGRRATAGAWAGLLMDALRAGRGR